MSDEKKYRVTSHNQQGGITAGEVHIGPQPRKLDENRKAQLRQHLPTGVKVEVIAVVGDADAFQFAKQTKTFLEDSGYDVKGVTQAMFREPVVGQHIEAVADGFKLVIGARQ